MNLYIFSIVLLGAFAFCCVSTLIAIYFQGKYEYFIETFSSEKNMKDKKQSRPFFELIAYAFFRKLVAGFLALQAGICLMMILLHIAIVGLSFSNFYFFIAPTIFGLISWWFFKTGNDYKYYFIQKSSSKNNNKEKIKIIKNETGDEKRETKND